MSSAAAGDPAPTGPKSDGQQKPPEGIVCVDCGGACHLLTWELGDDGVVAAAYRCEDCLDRWDLEFDPADEPSDGP